MYTSFHKIIFRNSIVNTVRYVINYSIIFVLTPIIIKGIGDAQYGLWALIFSLIGYAGILDLGVQQATIKLVSEYRGKKDIAKLNEIVSSILLYFFAIGVAVGMICWFVLPRVMHFFIKDVELLKLASVLLLIIGVNIIFSFLKNVFTGISLGLHQYHLKCVIDICCGLLRLVATIYVLNHGYGLIGLAWIVLILDIVATIFLYIVCVFSNSSMSVSFKNVKLSAFKEIFSFGGKIFMASTVIRINAYTIIVLISYFLTTTMTAYYNVVNRLVGSVQEVLWSLTASLFPVFSELSSTGDKKNVWKYYAQYTRYFLLLTIPAALGLLFFGTHFILLWINSEYANNTQDVMMLLSMGVLVAGLQPLAARVLIGGGEVSFYTKATVIKGIGVLFASIPLIMLLGLSGPPLALLLGEIIYQICIFYFIMQYFNIGIKDFVKFCYAPVIFPILFLFICFQIMSYLIVDIIELNHVIVLAFIMILYVIICFVFSLNNEEKKYLMTLVNRH